MYFLIELFCRGIGTKVAVLFFMVFTPGCETEDDSGGGGVYKVLYEVTGTACSLYSFTSDGQHD